MFKQINVLVLTLIMNKFKSLQFKTVLIITLIIASFVWIALKGNFGYIFFLFKVLLIIYLFSFFVATLMIIFKKVKNGETTEVLRYEWLYKLFNNQVQVVEEKENGIVINSYVPYSEILKKKDILENRFNRRIVSITRKSNSYRTFVINFDSDKKAKFKEFYMLSEYIKEIEVSKKYNIPAMLGVDRESNNIIVDMMDMYHTFISGETSGGKSTLLNTMIQSMQYFCNNVMFIMVDFKLVGLGIYRNFRNCVFIRSDNEFKSKLTWLKDTMMQRYEMFLEAGVVDILEYHQLGKKMNYIVLIIDEISNIKLSGLSRKKKDYEEIDIEDTLTQLLNMARASGIILIACTQNPAGVELDTKIRNKFITNISGRIARTEVQKMTGVMGTKHLQRGEFKMMSTNIEEVEFKSYFQNKFNNSIFEELKVLYENNGGVNLEKQIIEIEN